MFHFGIRPAPDGVQLGSGGQRVNMLCGCAFLYIMGTRKWRITLCWEHEGELLIAQATIINREQACCRN